MKHFALQSEYRVPKQEISVEIQLLGHPRARMKLFLAERAQSHSGPERPSDLLNGPWDYLPALEPGGKLVVVRRDAVMVLSVSAEMEFSGGSPGESVPNPEPATMISVEMVLEDGTEVRGTVCFAMPEGRNRLIDFLNTQDRFLTVREDSVARLVNKRRIVRIGILPTGEDTRSPWPSSTG